MGSFRHQSASKPAVTGSRFIQPSSINCEKTNICEALRCVSFIICTYKEHPLETQMREKLILLWEETEGDVGSGSWRRARIFPGRQSGGGGLLEQWIIRAKSLRPRRAGSLREEVLFLGARKPGSLCSWENTGTYQRTLGVSLTTRPWAPLGKGPNLYISGLEPIVGSE